MQVNAPPAKHLELCPVFLNTLGPQPAVVNNVGHKKKVLGPPIHEITRFS
jgi:hypothetical protein